MPRRSGRCLWKNRRTRVRSPCIRLSPRRRRRPCRPSLTFAQADVVRANGFDAAVTELATPSAPAVVPPQNLEAEESVIGAMLLSPTAIGTVTEILDASDFYRESHGTMYRAALALWAQGRARRRDHAHRRARGARRAGARRRHRARRGAGGARPVDLERRALRTDRQGDGDAARAHPRRPGDQPSRPGRDRRDRRPRRPGRADGLRPVAEAGHRRLLAHRGAAQGELRADHRTSTRPASTSPASRAGSATSTGSPRGSSPGT